jgi:ABC-type transporter Mla subunit MlaD
MTASDNENGERLSSAEIGKDAVQATIEAAAGTVGEVATILTNAVSDVATAIGDFATEVFEIRDASRKAADAGADQPIPAVDDQLDDPSGG